MCKFGILNFEFLTYFKLSQLNYTFSCMFWLFKTCLYQLLLNVYTSRFA